MRAVQLNTQLHRLIEEEFREEIQQKVAQLQEKNEEIRQKDSNISRLQREVERLQVCQE